MKKQYGVKGILLAPLIFAVALVALLFEGHISQLDRELDDEYERIGREFFRASKMLTILDYSFNNYIKVRQSLRLTHTRQIVNGVCQMRPKLNTTAADGDDVNSQPVNPKYIIVGDEALCDRSSALYHDVGFRIALAPVISFLHDLDDYLIGVHYIDPSGYVISSPETLTVKMTPEVLQLIKSPDWEVYQNLSEERPIKVRGPIVFREIQYSEPLLSLMLPVYANHQFEGMISLDILLKKLLGSNRRFAGKLNMIDTRVAQLPPDAYRAFHLSEPGILFHHSIYYRMSWKNELYQFVHMKKNMLFIVAAMYVLAVMLFLFMNTRSAKSYYEGLAVRDPLTGLRNRRGFEAFLESKQHQSYVAIAMFDIDDFKAINDSFGHDVGDDVIRYVGDQVRCHIRSTDTVARYGGEEFVLYLTAEHESHLKATLLRVKEELCNESDMVVEKGFTISGGVEIIASSELNDIDAILKSADKKLYAAKASGKNQLIF
ncbi:sensor domain-containing diguanylate cyclase [Vibrio mangrovi]|uniref:diguanylate cyclase n=1 Tax=Vibrio mangrovi TaxID=474394 RepID=A0A1Y6IMI0_9VIBR|nr:sensor domain-containing diguanylate cyclase [Vibrio mangrovi]MDW6004355.1 diguanylate cyclase [Vibrio mangrovi]SMR98846.1 putative diguanylate cyclase AdrA [Vibrio mangrovi]